MGIRIVKSEFFIWNFNIVRLLLLNFKALLKNLMSDELFKFAGW